MRPLTIASAVLAAGSSAQQTAHIYIQPLGSSSAAAAVSSPPPPPAPLAEITYELSHEGGPSAHVTSYEAPELPDDESESESALLVRIGLYDPAAQAWIGATSAASAANFGKGYSPHFLVNLLAVPSSSPADTSAGAGAGEEEEKKRVQLLGASLKGVRIDAGQTRDFGPQVQLVVASRGKQPELNRPVVLSPEGKKVGVKEEKTFLQKFVLFSCPSSHHIKMLLLTTLFSLVHRYWWMIGIALLLAMGGGGGEGK